MTREGNLYITPLGLLRSGSIWTSMVAHYDPQTRIANNPPVVLPLLIFRGLGIRSFIYL